MKKTIIFITIIIFIFFMAPASLRAAVSDRVWPQNYGQASLCLWKDDALGAISYTIDDNTAIDHNWWIEMSQKYGFKATWFVITERITDGAIGSNGYAGTWNDFRRMYDLGHDIQSHTVNHRVWADHTEYGYGNIDYEYEQSKLAIEAKMPGNKVLTIAYPSPGSYDNDPEVAKKYYIGGRGVGGLLNIANDINYMNTFSISSFNYDPGFWASITNILVYNPGRTRDYRGWQCMHFHGVDKIKDNLIKGFEYVKAHRNDLWVGLFREVVLYGQERDTAQLSVTRAGTDEIEFLLTDQQDNRIFDFPLTVKVRLDGSWNKLYASQEGMTIAARLIEHQGYNYALVDAVPDKGRVILKKESAPTLFGDVSGDGSITAYDAALTAHIAVGLAHQDIKNRAAADVSGDGEVTAYDAALIAQRAVGLIDRFPVER